MKLTIVKNNLSRITFLLGLTAVLLWACGDAETKEEAAEPAPIETPAVTDTTATDTTEVDTTSAPKDPVPIKTPETPQ